MCFETEHQSFRDFANDMLRRNIYDPRRVHPEELEHHHKEEKANMLRRFDQIVHDFKDRIAALEKINSELVQIISNLSNKVPMIDKDTNTNVKLLDVVNT